MGPCPERIVESAAFARRIDSVGYSHLWLPEAIGRDPFAHAAYLLGVTERLRIRN